MREAELRRCDIQEWYPSFKTHTIKTLIHPLPESFIRYILGKPLNDPPPAAAAGDDDDDDDDEDHNHQSPCPFFLPRSITGADPLPRTTTHIDPISSLSLIDSDGSDSDESSDPTPPSFPELESAVQRSIDLLGGAAFPKLNWSAPKDAAWISFDGTLRCASFADVALLLHSSDSAAHDLSLALPSCSDHSPSTTPPTFHLALRKFYPSLRPEMEFRCFARRRRLIAISQRDITAFYPTLVQKRHSVQPLIELFFESVVRDKFESEDYTFDVYVTKEGKVKIVDFNPWGAFTLPLMFSWEEMEEEGFGAEGPVFRVVESQCGVRPGLKTAVPYDYLDTGEGSGWDQFFKKVDEEQRKQVQQDSEGDPAQ